MKFWRQLIAPLKLGLILIVAFSVAARKGNRIDTRVSDQTSLSHSDGYSDPFEYLARFLLRSKGEGFKSYSEDEISTALSTLASGQSTWKSMDGVTHQLRNTFADK